MKLICCCVISTCVGLNWGVWGAALAATISQWVSCVLLVSLMFERRLLGLRDLMLPPQWHEVVPYLWKGAVLAFRMIITFGECWAIVQVMLHLVHTCGEYV